MDSPAFRTMRNKFLLLINFPSLRHFCHSPSRLQHYAQPVVLDSCTTGSSGTELLLPRWPGAHLSGFGAVERITHHCLGAWGSDGVIIHDKSMDLFPKAQKWLVDSQECCQSKENLY
jgi:hypothetical protein